MSNKVMRFTFEEWISEVFDHPISGSDPWYWNEHYNEIDLPETLSLEFLTRLFSHPEEILVGFTDAQINQGFWYIIPGASSSYVRALFASEDWSKRKICTLSIFILFRDLFNKRCAEKLSHGRTAEEGLDPLNSICYMFWDLIPYPSKDDDQRIYECYLNVMEEILTLKNIACQESALHGLGHSFSDYPKRVETVIDRFLSRRSWIREDICKYATAARIGNIQ